MAALLTVPTILGAVALLLVVMALLNIVQQRRLTIAARTWLLIALIFGAVILWLHDKNGPS
jgi:apolipoprotein N-acyltransferase